MRKIQDIIDDYRVNYQKNANDELNAFRIQPTLEKAISYAALAQIPKINKRFSHQYRLRNDALYQAKKALFGNQDVMKSSSSFNELYQNIETIVGDICGLGELYVYDTTIRIGAWLGLAPDEIFVHAGVRTGVRNLGLDPTRLKISRTELPKAFAAMEAHEIEDIMCIYKDEMTPACFD
jgi:hypothetical protein